MSKYILVADDDQAILTAIQIILEDEGYTIKTASDYAQIQKLIDEDLPELMLLDIWLGSTNGRDIAIKYKNDSRTKNIPIVFISANNQIAQLAKEGGVDDYLPKPFDITNLLDMVTKYL